MGGGIVETADRCRGSAEYESKGKLNLGWSQFKAGKLAEAAATLDNLLKENPPEAIAAEAALVRGRSLQELGQSEAALAMYNLLIERYPGSPHRGDALLAAARLQVKLKQPAAAAATYRRLADNYPRFTKLDAAINEWAWLMLDLGKPRDAAQLFERLHRGYPESRFWADGACQLAWQALRGKDYRRADALIDEVLTQQSAGGNRGAADQSDAKVRQYAMLLRGQIAVAKADWPKVREAFEALLKDIRAASGGCWRNTGSPNRTIGNTTMPPRSLGSSRLPSGSGRSTSLGWRSSRCGTPNRWRSRTDGATPRRSPPRSKRTSPISSSSTRSIICWADVSPIRENLIPLGRHTRRCCVRPPARRPKPRRWPNG